MSIPKAVVTRLAKQHPHSADILKAFVPLLEAQNALAEKLPAPEIPPLDTGAFAQGKPWLPALSVDPAVYLDEVFLRTAPKVIAAAAGKGLPELKIDIRAIGNVLGKQPDACRELATFRLKGELPKVQAWAKKRKLHDNAAMLFAMHLAGGAAKRVEKATSAFVLPAWSNSYCPVCGSRPHASCLKTREGKRFLQCSLCRHEWLFSRTTCPVCEQDSPLDLPIFFLEDKKFERAEGCAKCKHYILGLDMRELLDDAPLELYLLCMMPLDLLMEEKGFTPAVSAG